MYKLGDIVRVVSVPSDLPEGDIQTKTLFDLCLGRTFPIVGFQGPLCELHVGGVRGRESSLESIWIEPEHLEPAH